MATIVEFPHTFVINLDERQDRWAHISELCEASGIQIERVSAKKETPGWIGNGKSHLECLRRAVQRRLPWVLVLEDDALFTPESIKRFRDLLPHLWAMRERWDVFNGGATLMYKPELEVISRDWKLVRVQGFTAHFLLYQQSIYSTLRRWNAASDREFDTFMFRHGFGQSPAIRTVATTPGIATQLVDRSDIFTDRPVHDQLHIFNSTDQLLLEFLAEHDWINSAQTCTTVNAIHRYWRSEIQLELYGTAALLPIAQSRARYSRSPGVLVMRWHWHPPEVFLDFDGHFVLADFAIEYLNETADLILKQRCSCHELVHPIWSDRLYLIHDLHRAVRLSDGLAGTYIMVGTALEIQWDAYPKEMFLPSEGRYKFVERDVLSEST